MNFEKEMMGSPLPEGRTLLTVCPFCAVSNPVAWKKKVRPGQVITVQCLCGKKYSVVAELRKAYRRAVALRGTYSKTNPVPFHGNMVIKNISMTGVGFRTDDAHTVQEGDNLLLRFALNDDKQTTMEMMTTVIHVAPDFIGCSFEELTSREEDILASYLMLIP